MLRTESGRILKNAEQMRIEFVRPFVSPPNVVVSQEACGPLNSVETIISISETCFVVEGEASGGHLQWIAHGESPYYEDIWIEIRERIVKKS